MEFEGKPGFDLTIKSLENRQAGIRLLNVRTRLEGNNEVQLATVYVPRNKSAHFLKRIQAYKEKNTNSLNLEKTKPQHEKLVASIEDIRVAMLKAFWTDDLNKMPGMAPRWIEVWLSSDANSAIAQFRQAVAELGIPERKPSAVLRFPERTVLLLRANEEQLLRLLNLADQLAELRAAREPCSYFIEAENREQTEWVQDLLKRASFDPSSNISVCILDRGINSGHPMLAPVLADEDLHTVDPAWGKQDHHRQGHGTRMAGIAIYGDVQGAIDGAAPVEVRHRLESAKILPPDGQETPRELWGYMTAQGIYRAEIQAPQRRRIVCMAVTAMNTRDRGKPTSWSAELDQLAAGSDDIDANGNGVRRLILVSAGNINEPDEWARYPNSNITNEIHDPAQSWNALSVGAYTNLTSITHPDWEGYTPIAPLGGLAPCSTTSVTWSSRLWPVKPDIVLEGGNIALSPSGAASDIDDLQVLSTYHKLHIAHFAVFGQTSAATAHAAYFAARIYSEYPDLWPETVRALLVHSANWTDAMKKQFLRGKNKADYKELLRSCGYGVPTLNAALHCLRNRLTLVSEAQLQPFKKKENGGGYATNELHLYELPWPAEELERLGEIEVKLRVTLSYYIEPGPGEIGWRDRYRYASHGLRFELNDANETRNEFLRRVNELTREEDEAAPNTSSPSKHWLLGSQQRDVGSIHSDIWTGTAAALASSNLIAIRPSIGWWRERAYLGRWDSQARYSLIVSIETPSTDVDIYTRIAEHIKTQTATPVEIEIET